MKHWCPLCDGPCSHGIAYPNPPLGTTTQEAPMRITATADEPAQVAADERRGRRRRIVETGHQGPAETTAHGPAEDRSC